MAVRHVRPHFFEIDVGFRFHLLIFWGRHRRRPVWSPVFDNCRFLHPNGWSAKEPVCYAWRKKAGCTDASCKFTHPNGKQKKDDESSGDDKFNTRDLASVGKRHTPVDKGEAVRVDPKAKEAHERNRHRRVRLGNGNVESD